MSYRIGSFNLYKCSFESDKNIKKDFDRIAQIISNEQFDIVALQEVFTPHAVEQIVRRLPGSWSYRWAEPKKTVSNQAREGYAFIWNNWTMELSWSNKLEIQNGKPTAVKHTAEPLIFNQYHVDPGWRPMLRNPYYGRFRPLNCFCEIRLLNTHIRFGKDKDDTSNHSDIEMRKKEFAILTRQLYHRLSKENLYGNGLTSSYTIILGDYNLNLNRDWTKGPYLDEVVVISDNGVEQRIRTVQDQLTTLKRNYDNEEEDRKLRGYANNYDHFSYDEDRFREITVKAKKVDTVRKYCKDDFAQHKVGVSDHVPVYLQMDLSSRKS